MNTSGSSASLPPLFALLKRFNAWRARRIYRQIIAMAMEAERLKRKADRLIGDNVKPPMPTLFDNLDEGR